MKKVSVTIPQQEWGTVKTKYPPDSIRVRLDDLTGSSKNFDSIVSGALTKRPGGINYEQSTDADGPNKDQFEAIFTDGVHHLLKVVAGKLKYSSGGGTFSTVTTGYSPLGNFEFAIYQDRVYFGNGIDSPQVYDRTTSYGGVAYTAPQTKVMGAQAPSSAPTFAADSAGGNVPAGAHTYKVTYLYYDSEESNGGPASALRTVVNPNNTVNLTAVPIGGYGVTARKIYRDDNDGNWLLVGSILDNTTTTFADTASTGTAAIPLSNNVPPGFKYIVTHLDRTWIAGVPGDPSSLRFSEAGLPDIFPSANELLCNPEDPITALVVYDKKVWVFNRNSIGRILGSTRDAFQYVPLPGSVGCVDNRSIRVRTIDGIPTMVWLSDKGIYGTNGSSVEYLSDPIEDLVNLNIQQAVQVKGQNAQTTQSHFQAGTASPGIDLTTLPGTITTPNPKRLWDDEADWEGGSSLTNVATNSNNQLRVPTRHAPAFSSGSHANTQEISGTIRTPTSTDFTGTSQLSGTAAIPMTRPAYSWVAARSTAIPRTGTITQITVRWINGSSPSESTRLRVYSDLGGTPNSVLFESGSFTPGLGVFNLTASCSVAITAGQRIWLAAECKGPGGILFIEARPTLIVGSASFATPLGFTGLVWEPVPAAPLPGGTTPTGMLAAFTYVSTPAATSGIWTGPVYDSYSDSAVTATISHTGSFPAGTSSSTTVEGSNVIDFSSGVISQSFGSLNGSSAVSLSNKRYWRIKIQLTMADDRVTAQVGPATLKFNTTATWISEVIDHTTDITALSSLATVQNVPSGTTVTVEIATSADNITYSAFGPVGGATPLRYSKVRIILTTTGDNVTTPTVTNAQLNWTLVSNLVSSAIDTGATPAGWDLFQAQYVVNGGTVQFYMRSATTAGGLTAETFVAVTNGQFPAIPVRRYVQWKVILTSMAGAVPTVDSVTVNWFISQVSSIRVASIFYNRSYYLAAAEFNETANNLLVVLDGEGKWRTYRGINVNTFGLFFNDPYYGSATEGRIVRFLSGATDRGVAIEMVVETKAIDFGDVEHDKVGRKVYLKGKNTGATYQLYMSFDGGSTYYPMLDVLTGLTSYTTASDGKRFRRRFQLDFSLGNRTSGKTVKIKIVENTVNMAEIDELKIEAWIRQGELVN